MTVHINAETVVQYVLTFCNFASKVILNKYFWCWGLFIQKAATLQIFTLTHEAVKNKQKLTIWGVTLYKAFGMIGAKSQMTCL